jgi:TolA-binding protein
MNHDPQTRSNVNVVRLVLAALTFLSLALTPTAPLAQSAKAPFAANAQSAQPQAGVSPQSAVPPPAASPNADLAQMRTDLDRMESLLGNMSSEIEFLRDQNLQILLRTNAQMWTMLIRDLRRQVDREEQQRNHR